MYFLEQIRKQFLAWVINYDANPTDGPTWWTDDIIDQHIARNDVDTPENLAFQELNEELDAIDNDSKLVSTYTTILGSFLEKVKAWEYPWLSEEDDDFQRLLELYTGRFEELKTLSERGHEIEDIIEQSIWDLEWTVDKAVEWWDIDRELIQAYDVSRNIDTQKWELTDLTTQRESYGWILNEKQNDLPHGMTLSQQVISRIDESRELVVAPVEGTTIDEQITFLTNQNTKILESFTLIDAEIEAEITQFNIDAQETRYTQEQIPEMIEGMEAEKAAFRKVFFENILWEPDEWKPLSEYREHEKVQAFESETPEWHQFGYSLEAIIDAYSEINVAEWLEVQERGEALNVATEWYERLNRSLGIIERDMTELESWETVGEKRLETTHEGYKNMVLNEDGSLTAIWESIATWDESVEPQSSRLPNFEDLKMDQIKLLKEAWADLRVLFLTTPNGEQFNPDVANGGWLREEASYIVNFSWNRELAHQMDFAFMDFNSETIEVDGEVLTFKQDGSQWAGYYTSSNEVYPMQDGSIIKIWNRRETNTHVDEAISRAVNERLDWFAQASAQERAVAQAIMSWNPGGNFDTSKLPWGLAGAFLALILNMFDGRNFEYNPDTKLWEEKPEWSETWASGSPLTNWEVIWAYRGSVELWSLSARFESSSQWPVAYNPDDNWHWPSYGTYQMNSEVWVHRSFIQKHGIADGRAGWMAAVQQYGHEEFQRMEHEHIKENNYDPMMRRITVNGKENFSMAMQNVIWSIGVQHGPWHRWLLEIINTSGVVPGDKDSEATLINALYDKRERIWPAGVASRYIPERADALAMLNTLASSEIPNIYEQGLNSVPAWTRSVPTPSGYTTPQCSMVARQNLQEFWLSSVNRWASAKASFEMYPSERITAFPPAPWSDAKVADFYMDASERYAQYGHRVAAYESGWQWYVLDPYYSTPWYSDTRAPIKAEDYMAMMESKDPPRRFWWAAYFK